MTLTELHQRYRAQIDAFNANPPDDSDEFNRVVLTTFHRTFKQMIRRPVRTKADALVALDLLAEEIEDGSSGADEKLLAKLRAYIEGRDA